ncbi:MAG: hypothetical protein JJLCMIEE_00872 [Acidimicrobiales bacterium]|nr:hypothetical protein [Acidimicrobiales bacterium]
MNGPSWVLLAATVAAAILDWWAVGAGARRVELIAKPVTLLCLLAAAVAVDPTDEAVRAWFVAALGLSLLGDVFLLFPDRFFLPGLVSFLLGHLAYIVGFWVGDIDTTAFLIGVLVVAAALATLGRRILVGVRHSDEPELSAPVLVYVVVISTMVASAIGSTIPAAVAGSVLFYVSDALIAWSRFIEDHRWTRLAIIVTYHLGQIGLVLSLVS